MRVGVFVGQVFDGGEISLETVAFYARNLPQVERVEVLGLRPRLDPHALAGELRRSRLERIVLAGDSPGHFKPAFARAAAAAGLDAGELRLASFREHGVRAGGEGLERAKAVLACAVQGVPFPLVAVPHQLPVNPATLIIGGGVAGIQAALEIADAGKQVYLIERGPTIGGHMAMFDKTFPTLDCSACILTPKMVAVADHEMITLMTCTEVLEVTGLPGAFAVQARRHPRRVDPKACIACNACTDVCPVSTASEFDSGLTSRKAIYIPFPQAVPNANVVDPETCRWVLSHGEKCGACVKKCPKDCIHLDEPDEQLEFKVGNIVLATGYDLFDAQKIERYGYGRYPNVLTSLEFERMTNASGPTGGKIVLKTPRLNKRTKTEDWVVEPGGAAPRSVAIIHCVGSRDANYNAYCSRVCCMYSLKFAHLVREKLPDATCHEFYIDMRAFGKGYEEFMERIKAEGTQVIRGRTAQVVQVDGQQRVRGEDILRDRHVEYPADLVILAVGVVPAQGTAELAAALGLPRDGDGWFSELNYNGRPTQTERGGIFVAGMCQGPKDIPDTVAQASAVAAGVLKSIASGHGEDDLSTLTLSEIEARARAVDAALVEGW
ncbi:CoB--CoM heterodisulfide reductase iron-sulfur subunit A family protein [bacterium]|nr:CoB--CoM heterodisulfide reductase iron-sulfur subunit A family protein [bacterium]